MKKLAISAFAMASVASLSAQSLFDLAPAAEEDSSIPLNYTFSAGIGYDDNASPIANPDNDSSYGTAQVGASLLNVSAQTRTEFYARVGVVHYFDDLGPGIDQSTFTAGFGFNWNHRVSERLRLVSRNYLSQELEPDREAGFGGLSQVGAYLRFFTDNSIGYRWTERLGTYTGVIYDSLSYDDSGIGATSDVDTITFYNDFRYQLSPQTVATLSYRYSDSDPDGASDSTNQFVLAGLEHRFSSSTIGVIRAGAQFRDVDGGSSTTTPSFEASLNSQLSSQLSVRGYARYSIEDYTRSFGGSFYDNSETLRLGIAATYTLSPSLSLRGGINYQDITYDDDTLANASEDLLNLYVGFNVKVAENIWVSGTYNFEDAGSDDATREYDRNRVNFGVSATF